MTRHILAAAGTIFVLLVIAAITFLIVRLVKSDSAKMSAESNRALPPSEEPLTLLRSRYDSMFIALEIPHNAMIARMACNNYSARGASLRHYCWVNNGVFMMFPLWESLVVCGGELISPDLAPREWRIQVTDIICYAFEQGLPNKFVVLQFRKNSEILSLAFDEDSLKIFSLLFPEKDFTHLLEEFYPKSSRNIRDIKENFLSLKELREGDLITEEEYTAKKKEMLILM